MAESRKSGGFRGKAMGRSSERDQGGFRGNNSRDHSPSSPMPMYDATCTNCGNDCQVPFQPSAGKPVLCRECFYEKRDSSGKESYGQKHSNESSRGRASGYTRPERPHAYDNRLDELKRRIDKIDTKLDLIIESINNISNRKGGEAQQAELQAVLKKATKKK